MANLEIWRDAGGSIWRRRFQVHGVDARARRVVASSGAAACWSFLAGSRRASWRWRRAGARPLGREIAALGHEVKLIPPAHVKPDVRRNKTDAADAAAICEAALRPQQRFVPLRSVENQAELMRHRLREQLVSQRRRC